MSPQRVSAFPVAVLIGIGFVSASDTNSLLQTTIQEPLAPGAICERMHGRSFVFQDTGCDATPYEVEDMMAAFSVEQKYWSEQGDNSPWQAVLSGEAAGNAFADQQKLDFYQTGIHDIERMKTLFEEHKLADLLPANKSKALDLGCGLGRMGNALVSLGFEKVLCVDQAQSMLQGAQKELTALAGRGAVDKTSAQKIDFVNSGPDLLCKVEPGSLNFVHSIITLQHMKPKIHSAYVEQLCDALAPGGSGFFQIPVAMDLTFGGAAKNDDEHCLLNTEKFMLMMHYTPEAEVKRHLESRGCKVEISEEYDMIGPVGKSMAFAFRKN